MDSKIAAIIVSHNSAPCLALCLQSLKTQTENLTQIVVVDSGSDDTSYLYSLKNKYSFQLLLRENIGFSKGNNAGVEVLNSDTDFILFINPDVFLQTSFIARALAICKKNQKAGIVSGKLLSYDLKEDKALNRLDSTGVQRTIYGRWYDRGQGEIDRGQYDTPEDMPALCGALMFCRNKALMSLQTPVFDPDFFLYKEDLELCLRLRKRGWKLLYHPVLWAYHCRGWQNERSEMPFHLRKIAAQSEVLLYRKHPSVYMVWALVKFFLVNIFRI